MTCNLARTKGAADLSFLLAQSDICVSEVCVCLKSRMWCGKDAETRWWKGKRLRSGRCWLSPSHSHSERKVSHHSLCVGWKQVFWEQAGRCVCVCLCGGRGVNRKPGRQTERSRCKEGEAEVVEDESMTLTLQSSPTQYFPSHFLLSVRAADKHLCDWASQTQAKCCSVTAVARGCRSDSCFNGAVTRSI